MAKSKKSDPIPSHPIQRPLLSRHGGVLCADAVCFLSGPGVGHDHVLYTVSTYRLRIDVSTASIGLLLARRIGLGDAEGLRLRGWFARPRSRLCAAHVGTGDGFAVGVATSHLGAVAANVEYFVRHGADEASKAARALGVAY